MTLPHMASRPVTDRSTIGAAALPALPAPRTATVARPSPDAFDAPVAAERSLTAARPDDRDTIAWLSEHLAALDRVVYPAVRRLPADASAALRSQQVRSRDLALLLRRLHAQLNGDGAVRTESLPALRRRVLSALRAHTAGERDLITRLQHAMTGEQWLELTSRYAEHVKRGPTRPHPHSPHAGLMGRLAHSVNTVADRTLDVLDSRAVRPLPVALGASGTCG